MADNNLAVYFDLENVALGMHGRRDDGFDVRRVIQRLLTKGNVIVKRAYADWSRYGQYTRSFHEAAVEMISIPRRSESGKNSADIRLCVDAMEMCYAKPHLDTFVIVSGDSDFSPLVAKLRENAKHVIGLGVRGSTSGLLVATCDEFIFYDGLARAEPDSSGGEGLPEDKEGVLRLAAETVAALLREGRDPIQASLIKDTIRRQHPSFSESSYGYRSLTDLLEDAESQNLITLREDPRSGTYVVDLAKSRRRKRG